MLGPESSIKFYHKVEQNILNKYQILQERFMYLKKLQTLFFIRFPKDHRFQVWLKALGVGAEEDFNITWRKSLLICSDHFHAKDFKYTKKRSYIKAGAIPCLKLVEDQEHNRLEETKTTTVENLTQQD